MALRNIVTKEDDILRKKSRVIEKFDDRLSMLIDDMIETLKEANGAGLAAVQVGVLKRVVIVDVPLNDENEETELIELINPEIIKKSGIQQEIEGCLSYPNLFGYTKRPMHVTVRAQDRYGKEFEISGSGLLARALCHEIDHLDGIHFTDHVVEYVNVNQNN